MKIKRQTRRRAAARDVPLHLGVRRRARLADRRAARLRLRRLRHPRPDHDGLGDQRVLEQLVVDPPAEVPARDRRPALLAGLAARAAAGVLARRLPARHDRGAADLQRASSLLVDLPVEHVAGARPVAVPGRASSSPSSACWWACGPSSSTTSRSRRRSCCTPLIFLGGVFYSASLLPEPFQTLTHFNPVYYMIGLVRYGFLGYTRGQRRAVARAADAGHARAVRAQPARCSRRGYRLRA